MKDFLKYVFATVVGLGLAMLVATVLVVVSLAGMTASEQAAQGVRKGSVLRIVLAGELSERVPADNPFAQFMANGEAPLGLDELTAAISEAASNKKVEGIYLEVATSFAGGTPAMLQELRQALVDYKESGKWIMAYGDVYSQGAYYLASVADKVVVNPSGVVDWHGLGGVPVFFTDMMRKAGIKMQVFKVGTFKSAVEPFISTEMSAANREQVTSYLTSIWGQMLAEVGASRGIGVDELNALADTFTAMQPAAMLVESRLVDTLAYLPGFKEMLRAQLGLKEGKSIRFCAPADLAAVHDGGSGKGRVAVYYAFGDIVDQASQNPLSATTPVIETMPTIRELQRLRNDDDVKAVVLRVNSGGGSAYASEQIWHEVQLLREVKPVVVSMGGMAASGGYYISCGADRIYAEPTTLTGSIGIFGMIPDGSELLQDKLGLRFDVVKTNRHSDFGGPSMMGLLGRAFTADEARLMQAEIERGYDLFISRVAAGRGISKDSVDAIGQGRVWTGEQAMERGLVDELGNLDDAIAAAAAMAELDKYGVDAYPAPASFIDQLLMPVRESYFDEHLRTQLGQLYPVVQTVGRMMSVQRVDQCVYARVPFSLIAW